MLTVETVGISYVDAKLFAPSAYNNDEVHLVFVPNRVSDFSPRRFLTAHSVGDSNDFNPALFEGCAPNYPT